MSAFAGTLRTLLGALSCVAALMLGGCYPVHKLLNPASTVQVVDQQGLAIAGADVTLIRNAYPHRIERARWLLQTNMDGFATFAEISEWRVEALMIHGAEVFYWNWCVRKPGFETYATQWRNPSQFESAPKIALSPGMTSACPDSFR